MSPSSWKNFWIDGQVISLVSFTLIVVWFFSILFRDPLRAVPGPFLARFSRSWMVKHSWKGDMHRTMIDLHQKHGKLVRIGPRELSVSDLSAIRVIYGAGTKFRKSDWYSVWQGHRKFDLFAERDERIHGSQRRLVSRIYSMDSLKELERYVNFAIEHFIAKMEERLGQDIDLGLFVQLFAFGASHLIIYQTFSEPTNLSRCHRRGHIF